MLTHCFWIVSLTFTFISESCLPSPVLTDLLSLTLYLKLSRLSLPSLHPCNLFFFFFKCDTNLVEKSQKDLKDPGDVVPCVKHLLRVHFRPENPAYLNHISINPVTNFLIRCWAKTQKLYEKRTRNLVRAPPLSPPTHTWCFSLLWIWNIGELDPNSTQSGEKGLELKFVFKSKRPIKKGEQDFLQSVGLNKLNLFCSTGGCQSSLNPTLCIMDSCTQRKIFDFWLDRLPNQLLYMQTWS